MSGMRCSALILLLWLCGCGRYGPHLDEVEGACALRGSLPPGEYHFNCELRHE